MRRSINRLLPVVLAAALVSWGCNDDTSNPTNPDPVDVPEAVTEIFNGSVNVNGASTHPFMAQRAGTIVATLTTVAPAGQIIGLALGTWNGVTCQVVLANDGASQGISVTGSASNTGSFCVRLYDTGSVPAGGATYTVTIIRP